MLNTSYFFILPIILVALTTIYLMSRVLDIGGPAHRFAPIDGLRGFLAIMVFMHHSAFWYL